MIFSRIIINRDYLPVNCAGIVVITICVYSASLAVWDCGKLTASVVIACEIRYSKNLDIIQPLVVQIFPSSHVSLLCVHPVDALSVSTVQARPSSQIISVNTHPVAGLQVALYRLSAVLQFRGVFMHPCGQI
jgi:hypothetical protein